MSQIERGHQHRFESAVEPSDKQKRVDYFHDTVQKMETENRFRDLSLVTPRTAVTSLRLKYSALENARGVRPNLKQNYNDHVNTLYNHEAKYLGERAELYKTDYNPYILKEAIVQNKPNPEPTTIGGYSNKQDVVIPDDTYEHRPKLYANRVYSEHVHQKREPLENVLKYPDMSASAKMQENSFILKQSTYGDSYNTKKFLQESQFVNNRLTEPNYVSLHQADLDYQDIPIKSKAEQVALTDFKSGFTNDPKDYARAAETIEIVDRFNKKVEQTTYPRKAGPYTPEPYERIYCTDKIVEMSDGFQKRATERLYDSPFVEEKGPKYQPLQSDMQTLAEIDKVVNGEANRNTRQDSPSHKAAITTKDVKSKVVAKYDDEPHKASFNMSNYTDDYKKFYYVPTEKCPLNKYHENIQYTETNPFLDINTPSRLVLLQDKWSKSDAQKQFLSKYPTTSADLRENFRKAKKPVFISPTMAPKYFGNKTN